MQTPLSRMTPYELSVLVVPLILSHSCQCCGTRDLAHDETLCAQGAYAEFDAYRAQEIAAGRWVDEIPASEPVEVDQVQPMQEKPAKGRCPHYNEIRAFFALARERGMDTKAVERCRCAMGALLGRRIESRADMTRGEWLQATAALELGFLTW